MNKLLKDILPDKDPYHYRGRDQMRKKGVRNSSACGNWCLRQVWVRIPFKAQALVARNHPFFQFLFTYLVIKFHYHFIYFVFISIQLNGNISLHHVTSVLYRVDMCSWVRCCYHKIGRIGYMDTNTINKGKKEMK
jgi:hypothetical protein